MTKSDKKSLEIVSQTKNIQIKNDKKLIKKIRAHVITCS